MRQRVAILVAAALLAGTAVANPVQAVPKGSITHWVAQSGTPIGTGTSCDDPGYVGSSQVAIFTAIDAANNGDTVHICAGEYVYTGNGSTFNKDNFTIRGEGPGVTILDGNSDWWLMNPAGAQNLRIEGITFLSGYDGTYGAALALANSSVEIINCEFIDNEAGSYAGAIYTVTSDVSISSSTFTNNSSGTDGGGAIYIEDAPAGVTITDSVFTENSSEWGGAIVVDNSNLVVNRSEFTDNYTDYVSVGMSADYGGAGIYLYGGSLDVEGSAFRGNSTPDTSAGGAIHVFEGSLSVDRSEFSRNDAGQGPAIYSYGDGDPTYDLGASMTVTNSKFKRNVNSGDDGGAIAHERNARDFTLIGNTFYRNAGAIYGGAVETWLVYGAMEIKRNTFTANSALEGGALWLDIRNGVRDIRGNTFARNRAVAGGAIAFECATSSDRFVARVLRRQGIFYGNRATSPRRSLNVYSSDYAGEGDIDCNPPG